SDFDYFMNMSTRSSEGHRDNADGTVNHLYGHAGYELGENWYASLLVDYTEGDVGNPQPWGNPKLPRDERFLTDDWFYIMSISHDYEKVAGYLKLSFENGHICWEQWDTAAVEPFDSVSDWENYGLMARETFRLWEGGEVSVGYDLENFGGEFVERRPSGDRGDTSARFYNTGPYLLASQSLRPGDGDLEIVPSAGVRYNESRYFDGDWGAQAGVRAGYKGTEFHANYARAYNTPGVFVVVNYELFGRGDEWKDLDAETLDHFEVGVSREITPWLTAGITGFYDDVRDAIRFAPPPPVPPSFANVGDYEMAGGEATVEVSPLDNLRFFAGSAFMHTSPDDVPNVPEWTLSFGATWLPLERLTINVDGLWVDDHFVLNPRYAASQAAVDDYFLLHARVSYQLNPHIKLFAAGENLTDSGYEYRRGYPMPGISGLVGVEMNL
ncbi:MAG: TonB-dependent receptor, partial [Planctomycetes bacterium]|nr:TonB-dependent receptor [Planctomycetota bacterium]